MGLKKRSKVSAEFSMSSMTDVIFLLLIFFMLTSGIVAPNALNLKLPGKSSASKTPPKDPPSDVAIGKDGSYRYNAKRVSSESLDASLSKLSRTDGTQANVGLSPEPGAPVEAVVYVMDLCLRYNINAILTTEYEE